IPALDQVRLRALERRGLRLDDPLRAGLVEVANLADERGDAREVERQERAGERLGVVPLARRGHDVVDRARPQVAGDGPRVARFDRAIRRGADVVAEDLVPRGTLLLGPGAELVDE